MGRSFRVPSKSDAEQWRKVQALFAYGYRFYSYRTYDCEPLPEGYADVERFVAEHPDHPFRVGEVRHDLMPS
jgi:hypothetical protein